MKHYQFRWRLVDDFVRELKIVVPINVVILILLSKFGLNKRRDFGSNISKYRYVPAPSMGNI